MRQTMRSGLYWLSAALSLISCSLAWAQAGDEEAIGQRAASAIKTAEQVLRGLNQGLKTTSEISVRDIEDVAAWSRRVVALKNLQLLEDMAATQNLLAAEEPRGVLLQHIERMRELEKLVVARSAAGATTETETAAAKFFRHEAELMLARASAEAQRAAREIQPPEADAPPPPHAPKADEFVVTVDRKNRLWANARQVTLESLKGHLARHRKASGKLNVRVEAHSESLHSTMVQVLDLASAQQADNVTIMTSHQVGPLEIELDAQGAMAVDGQPVTVKQLSSLLSDRARANSKLHVAIFADQRCKYSTVVKVTKACQPAARVVSVQELTK